LSTPITAFAALMTAYATFPVVRNRCGHRAEPAENIRKAGLRILEERNIFSHWVKGIVAQLEGGT
jgi:hypothetical protein